MTHRDRRSARLYRSAGQAGLASPTGRGQASRRRFVQGAGALGLSAAGLGATGLAGFNRRGVGAQDVTTLDFSHDKAPWQDFFLAMGASAEAAVGVNWDPTSYADTNAYRAAVLPALSTSDAPDVFTWWSGYRLEELYDENVLLDVSDLWATAIADGNLPESIAANFTFADKQYAMPTHASYWVVFYNKKVFDEQGLTPPATWDEMLAAADQLKAADVIPFGATVQDRWPTFIWFEEMVLRTDPAFYQALTAGEAKYTDPTCVEAMETWKGLIEKGYFNEFDINLFSDVPGMFANGEIAMIPIGSWYQSNFLTAGMVPGEDYDVFVMPNINPDITENVAIVETGALCIPATSGNVDAAKEMLSWWISTEAQTQWSNTLGDAPANPKASNDNPVLTNLLGLLNDGNYSFYQRYWEASPVPIVENAVDFLAEFMLSPDDYMRVLEQIQGLADQEWEKRASS